MKPGSILAFVAMLCVLVGYPIDRAGAAVSQTDTNLVRLPLPAPASSVGRIVCRQGLTRYFSTASVISNRKTVLTVAHFNYDDSKRAEMPIESCRFELRSDSGRMVFSTPMSLAVRGGDAQTRYISRATDWALLTLDEAAPVRPIDVAFDHPRIDLKNVALLGFKNGVGRSLESWRCNLTFQNERSILASHRCPTSPGSSGAPLLSRIDGNWKIVGIHSGREPQAGIAVMMLGHSAATIRNLR